MLDFIPTYMLYYNIEDDFFFKFNIRFKSRHTCMNYEDELDDELVTFCFIYRYRLACTVSIHLSLSLALCLGGEYANAKQSRVSSTVDARNADRWIFVL